MRHILVPVPDWRKEGVIFAACAVTAIALNTYAIVAFRTPWIELITALPIVLVLASVFYALVCACRLVRWGVSSLIQQKSKTGRRP